MFTERMTYEEIRAEFEKEKKPLMNKVLSHGKRIEKLMRKTKMSSYDKHFDYTSLRKNKWVYSFFTGPKGKLYIHLYSYFYTKRSYAIIYYGININRLYYITSHFITRYFERQCLDTESPYKVIRAFTEANTKVVAHPKEKVGYQIYRLFGQMTDGVALGYIHQRINLHEYRTYITNEMLKGDQIELSKKIEEKFDFHILRNTPEELD